MSLWKPYPKKKVESEVISAGPGEIIPCQDPQNVVIVLPKDPEPDLSTKPADKVGYCFGYVCSKKHVNETFDSIVVDGYKERRACQECGGVAKPAVVRRTAEARWANRATSVIYDFTPEPNWGWYNSYWGNPLWNRFEFVHYLDEPKTRRKKK